MMAEFSLETLFKLHTTDLPNLIKDCLSPKLPGAEHVTADIDHWEEIGEGNLNFVYRVWLKPHDSTQECTVIVKYAPAYIKVRYCVCVCLSVCLNYVCCLFKVFIHTGIDTLKSLDPRQGVPAYNHCHYIPTPLLTILLPSSA